MTREQILTHMMAGFSEPLSDLRRQRILDAMNAFSITQLERLDRAGLRIWPVPNTLPPEFSNLSNDRTVIEVPNLRSPAAYTPELRVIRIFPEELQHGRAISYIRHELAHAWDDVKNEARVIPLSSMSATQRRAAVIARSQQRRPLASDMSTRLPPYNLAMSQMLERYRTRLSRTLREFSFAHSSTSEGHAGRTSREFYAEGYSVFFGSDMWCQARLLHFAPELFAYLETEARQFALNAPARGMLEDTIRQQRLPAISDPPILPGPRHQPPASR